ncbi:MULTISPECIES: hypothetical protein [unclassified Streptomyces]|uniref:hypothetical protein n=1 Tax=unclassified Streptomyces TaxID=2593676 RepID=UPI0036E77E31
MAGSGRPAQWPEAAWPGIRVVPVRIDLARSAGLDFEQIILTLRLALTQIGRPLPAFDIALRRYWEAVHPGEPLEEYLRRGGLARAFGQALPQQVQSALADVAQALLLPGTIGTVVFHHPCPRRPRVPQVAGPAPTIGRSGSPRPVRCPM